jgi:hypothetical protein
MGWFKLMNLRGLMLLFIVAGLLWGTQGCVYSGGSIAPTVALDPTQALQTVQALLTATLPAQGSTLVSSSNTTGSATPSPSATPTSQPSQTPLSSPLATAACDRAAAGNPIDVTIPDDTILEPGQAFTKIWKLENVGSCTWNKDYAAVFFYGDLMSAMEVVPIASYVEPGQSVEIAAEMVAPGVIGPYQGNWKLRNANGDLFGIGPTGDSPFWVRIIVAEPVIGSPTATSLPTFTPTPTKTPSPTPLPSATPPVAVQSKLILETDYLLDLDVAQVNPLQGSDLAYRTGSVGYHWLIPQDQALLGVYGEQLPGLQDCQSANKSTAPIAVESLASGLYLCYQTAQGQIGWLRLLTFDSQIFTLSLEILTWTMP